MSISIDEAQETELGDISYVAVNLKNNEGLLAYDFDISYGESLELVEVLAGDEVMGSVSSTAVEKANDKRSVTLCWVAMDGSTKLSEDGTIVYLRFKKIKPTTGDISIKNTNFYKDLEEKIEVNIRNGVM